MEKKLGALPTTVLTAVCALTGFLLRSAERSGGSATGLIVCSIVVTLALLALSLTFWKERDYARIFARSLPDAAASGLGAALMLIGGVLCAIENGGILRILGVLGAVSALLLLRAAALRWSQEKPSAWWHAPIIVFCFLKLFYDYRRWMLDPVILDYCFALFAMICFMFAYYHAAAFCFDRGKRRALLFFSMAGVYYGAVALRGADTMDALFYAGCILNLVACVWQASAVKEASEQPGSAPEQA